MGRADIPGNHQFPDDMTIAETAPEVPLYAIEINSEQISNVMAALSASRDKCVEWASIKTSPEAKYLRSRAQIYDDLYDHFQKVIPDADDDLVDVPILLPNR